MDHLGCLHVMLTNILGGFSLLIFLHCLGCSNPSTLLCKKKEKEINPELTGGNRRDREGQGVADAARGTTLIFALRAKTFWPVLFIPPFSLKISFDAFGCYAALVCVCGLLELPPNLYPGGGRSL